jgi:hypothetical protein
MKLRSVLFASATSLALIGGGVGAIAASSASAAPPVKHVLAGTVITTRVQPITPRISVISSVDYAASPAAPGFSLSGTTTEVCVTVPHVIPPTATTPLAVCFWTMTARPLTLPRTTLSGNAVLTGVGQVGRITSGTGAWAGAFSLPLSFRSANIAPRTASDSWTFFTP